MVQKLFNVENFLFLHCSYGIMASVVLFQHRITFEPNFKNQTVLESAHMQQATYDF